MTNTAKEDSGGASGKNPLSLDFFEDPFEDMLGRQKGPRESRNCDSELSISALRGCPSPRGGFSSFHIRFYLRYQMMGASLHSLPHHLVVVGWATSNLHQLLLRQLVAEKPLQSELLTTKKSKGCSCREHPWRGQYILLPSQPGTQQSHKSDLCSDTCCTASVRRWMNRTD